MPTFLTPGIRAVLKRGRRLAAAYKFRKNLLTFLTYCERTKPGLVGSIEPEELEFLEELMRLSADHPGPKKDGQDQGGHERRRRPEGDVPKDV